MNVMLVITMKKLGKNKSDLISTNMKITNFTSDVITAIGVLVTNITMGSKTQLRIFYVGCQVVPFNPPRLGLDSF